MKLGRYEVVRELGKGAMGVVYLAKDPLIGRLVALKTIRASQHADDDEAKEFQQRFVREAQAAGILNHPSIVTVHDIGQDEASGTSFIAMEYVEGQNLKEVLAQGRALTFDQIGDIIGQVAEALDFAHSKGIVHRDVKPANVILLEGNRAKITDFGIAKITSGGNLTSTGQFLGTPNYMAPEQIKGAPVDGRTDIFSLGICLYECLTRRKPFGGDSLTSISYKIVHEAFPPLHEINPQIPEGYEDVVSNALSKDPAKRYQRARDMAAALRTAMRGERPVRHEPLLADETVVTRDRDRLPTVDMPFPEASQPPAQEIGSNTMPAAGQVFPAAPAAAPAPAAAKAPAPKPAGPQAPIFRRRISPAIFLTIVLLLVAGLVGAVVTIRSRQVDVPKVDKQLEARRLRERQLRQEAQELLRQGRVSDAYPKIQELSKLAPNSPYVNDLMQRLNAMRQQEEISKQQQAQAQAKMDEAVALFNQKNWAGAIPVFQEAEKINPALSATIAPYVATAQAEQQKLLAARAAKKTTPGTRGNTTTAATTTVAQTQTTQPANEAPAHLTTIFSHPFTDGRIVVRVGADTLVDEQIWEEKRGLFGRKTKAAKIINTTKELTPKNADVDVWVDVPASGIREHHSFPATRFQPGALHRLLVTYDSRAKQFTFSFN